VAHGGRLADRLVLSKVRAVFRPHRPVVLTGAAPIGNEVLELFAACGLTVLEGYGRKKDLIVTSSGKNISPETTLTHGCWPATCVYAS
jgi:long-subunit acyl-CoA synthetase (AMP-forming)